METRSNFNTDSSHRGRLEKDKDACVDLDKSLIMETGTKCF